MEPFSAAVVYEMARSLEQLRATSNVIERLGTVKFSGSEIDPARMESIELLTSRSPMDLLPGWQNSALSVLTSIQKYCDSIGLHLAATASKDFHDDLSSGRIKTHGQLSEAMGTLDTIIKLQLRENLFMFVPPDRAKFYSVQSLFGQAVSARFPMCAYDIEEAGNCYAAGRATACAFHLMRVMELALQRFGTALGIALTNEKNWQNILDQINKAIRTLPPRDARTIALTQAAANLYNVKIAWRNPTMHPKSTYTMEEARDLILNANMFMTDLAQVV